MVRGEGATSIDRSAAAAPVLVIFEQAVPRERSITSRISSVIVVSLADVNGTDVLQVVVGAERAINEGWVWTYTPAASPGSLVDCLAITLSQSAALKFQRSTAIFASWSSSRIGLPSLNNSI